MSAVVVGLSGSLSSCGDTLAPSVGRSRTRSGVCLGVCLMVGRLIRLSDLCCISREWRSEATLARAVSMSALISSWSVARSFTSSSSTIFNGSFCLFTSSLGELICLAAGRIGVSRDPTEDRGVPEGVTRGEGFSGTLSLGEDSGGGCSGWSVSARMVGSCEALTLFKVEKRLTLSSSVTLLRSSGLQRPEKYLSSIYS